MRTTAGRRLDGPAGTATEVLTTLEAADPPDWQATVATWFLHCPGQSPAWSHYMLSVIHLRVIEGVKPAVIRVPLATHEVMLIALDPARDPQPTNPCSWSFLRPINIMEQIELPSDDDARDLLAECAAAVVGGVLPAEPMLSGAVEPWRTSLIKTAAHYRGEEHAP